MEQSLKHSPKQASNIIFIENPLRASKKDLANSYTELVKAYTKLLGDYNSNLKGHESTRKNSSMAIKNLTLENEKLDQEIESMHAKMKEYVILTKEQKKEIDNLTKQLTSCRHEICPVQKIMYPAEVKEAMPVKENWQMLGYFKKLFGK